MLTFRKQSMTFSGNFFPANYGKQSKKTQYVVIHWGEDDKDYDDDKEKEVIRLRGISSLEQGSKYSISQGRQGYKKPLSTKEHLI